jgi:hypothetical protein
MTFDFFLNELFKINFLNDIDQPLFLDTVYPVIIIVKYNDS